MRKIATTLAVALMATVAWGAGTAGSLDTTFDGDGVVRTAGLVSGSGMVVSAAVTDGSGNTYVVGFTPDADGAPRAAARRYGSTGLADLAYGDANGVALPLTASLLQTATGAALDAQGRLLVVGSDTWEEVVAGRGKKTSTRQVQAAFVARLDTTGALDTAFGDQGGVVHLELDWASGHNVTVMSSGKILITGYARVETTTSGGGGKGKKNRGSTVVSRGLMLVQLDGSGDYDATFGSDGVVLDDRSANDDSITIGGVALQLDGSIVIGGTSSVTGDCFVRRYNASGVPDSTFASGSGEALLKTGSTWGGVSVAVDGLDRIVAAFSVTGGTAGSVDGVVIRLDAEGDVDTSFGSGGEFQTSSSGDDDLTSIAVLGNGTVYAAGSFFPASGRGAQLLKLTSIGELDSTFGTGGYAASLPLPTGYHSVRSLVVDSIGDPILAGEYSPLTNGGALQPGFVARYCEN